jgi:hypothetical protein
MISLGRKKEATVAAVIMMYDWSFSKKKQKETLKEPPFLNVQNILFG